MSDTREFAELIRLAFRKEAITKCVFSKPFGEIKKASGRICKRRGIRVFNIEYSLASGTVSQENVAEHSLGEKLGELFSLFGQVNLITPLGDAELKYKKDGSPVMLGAEKLKSRLLSNGSIESQAKPFDNEKQRILTGKEDFLFRLGITDKNGRPHDKRQPKFRQINKFLEYVEDIYKELPTSGEIRIYDLCCGKSYLSFAVYHYLASVKKRQVYMLCVDQKRDVIDFCAEVARDLGWRGMRFVCDDVRNLPKSDEVHLVISLHACDIATDIVIGEAIRLGASVILSTPCCHKNLSDKIRTERLSFVTRFPKLRGKLCEAITDALRLMLLEANGYSVMATELVDPDDTPKNTLLRAILKGSKNEDKLEKYNELLKELMGDNYTNYLP